MKTTRTITSINPKSLALVSLVTYAVFGLVGFSLMALAKSSNIAYIVGYIVGGVVLYSILGLIIGWIGAIAYNFAAKKVGGIQVEVE